MTISELFEYVDAILENAFPDKIKLRWLNQVEAEIQIDVLLMAPEGIVQYTEADLNAELIVPTYYDQLYHEYLFWQICLAQQEDERANKYAVTYNRVYNEYVRFVCETVNPGDGMAEKVRYYLTAYQIAVKHGYTGTETEWLRSLKGDKGDKGDGLHLLGVKETEAELPEMAENGDAYLVGTTEENNLYVYDNGWKNMGPLRGKDGKQGEDGEPGKDGEPGAPGRDGTSVAVASVQESAEDGGTNVVTFSDGNVLNVKNGRKGSDGAPGKDGEPGKDGTPGRDGSDGAPGKDGTSVTITSVQESEQSGGTNVVAFSDGNTLAVKNGKDGQPGKDGSNGQNGKDGSDANVTAENITAALGYTPANPDDITAVEEVYRGPEPPTDPNVKLWINTSKPGNNPGGSTSAPADWDAAEGEPGHILNRTHYGEWVMLYPETELMLTDEGYFVGMVETEAKHPRTYRIKYNGVVYESETYMTEGSIAFGNMSAAGLGEDTGEPFFAAIMDGMLMVMPFDGATSVTMQIEMFEVVEKLPKHFYNSHVFIDVDVAEDGTYSTQVAPAQVVSELSEDDVPVIRLRSKNDASGIIVETIRYLTDLQVSLGGFSIFALFLDSMRQITFLTLGGNSEDYTIPYTIDVMTKSI